MIASALAYTYALEGQYGRAKELLNATLERRIRVSGENHIEALLIQERLAFVQRSERDFAGAEALLAKVLAARRRVLSSAHPDTLGTGCSLGFVQIKQQKYAEAETTLRDTLGAFDRFEVDTWQRHNCRALLGMSLAAQGRTDQARQPLRDGYEGLSNRQASIGVPNLFYMEEARNAVARLN